MSLNVSVLAERWRLCSCTHQLLLRLHQLLTVKILSPQQHPARAPLHTPLLCCSVHPWLLFSWCHQAANKLLLPFSGVFAVVKCPFVHILVIRYAFFFFLYAQQHHAVTFSRQDPFQLYLPCSSVWQAWFILVFHTIALFNNERQISKPPISHTFLSMCMNQQTIGFNGENDVTQ